MRTDMVWCAERGDCWLNLCMLLARAPTLVAAELFCKVGVRGEN